VNFMIAQLAESRAKFVRRYRTDSRPWPDGIGAWFRQEDWAPGNDTDGDVLIATGEARARALDPWSNMRAKGERCPPLPLLDEESRNSPSPVTNGRPPKVSP
jgi:hypothetical protein